jgi:hypothetical protein
VDQLIQQVCQRAGINPDQARTAVNTVLGYVKDRLPPQLASQLDGVVGESSSNMGNVGQQAQQTFGNVSNDLGNPFGGQQ